ncbi:MAG: glycosyltransferase [Alphaproteobacteria bacterium]|nr:glycosyltransferase [Alphaproteobacteria bacterium]
MKPAAPIRVAFVLPNLAAGGAERVALSLLAGLDRQRCRALLIVLREDGALRAALPADVALYSTGRPRLLTAFVPLLRTLRRTQPDVLFSTLGYVNLAVLVLARLLAKRPRVVIREANMPSASLPRQNLAGPLVLGYRLLYRIADAVIASSRQMANELAQRFAVPAARLHVLANPVDSAGLRRQATPPVRAPGDGARYVACGRLTAQKGFDRLLDMLPSLPGAWQLTILGDGPDYDALTRQAAALGLGDRVRLAGFAANPWSWFAGADALLLPSRWEGQSNVALEALACGCPVIATPEAGGIGELADEAAGAVQLAQIGAPFLAALAAVRPAPPACPRPSLLPARYEAAAVLAQFQRLLEG